MNSIYKTNNSFETQEVGSELCRTLEKEIGSRHNALVVCLYGDLGSGKTTFAQGFAKGLGITKRILSPTFIIVRRYELIHGFGFFYHLDLYRLEHKKQLEGFGLEEIFSDPNSIVLVEWAEKLGSLLPKNRVDIQFEVLSNEEHRLAITKLT